MPALPENTHSPGWPALLTDGGGNTYVLVRDGSPTSAFSGDSCLYARVGPDQRILRDRLYIPRLSTTDAEVSMAGGSWLSDEEAARYGVPPIKLPKEPVKLPKTRTRGPAPARSFPERNFDPGWPLQLEDTTGERYVRIRDGSPTSPFGGNSCLYARLSAKGRIQKDHQYVPLLGSSPGSVNFAGGAWVSAAEAKKQGVPPIELPEEPVVWVGA